MAQIRSKQIKDFLSTVDWGTVASNDIANAADTKAYVDGQQLAANTSINNRLTAVEGDLAAEVAATNSDVTKLTDDLATAAQELDDKLNVHAAANVASFQSSDSRIAAEEARMDAVLLAADADKDSFAEIVSLINAVDVENDDALATVISNLNTEITETNSEVVRLDGAIASVASNLAVEITETNSEVVRLDGALADQADANAVSFTSADTRMGTIESDLTAEIARAKGAEQQLGQDLSDHAAANVASFVSSDARMTGIEGDLSSEILATNSEVTRLDGAVATEKSRAIAEEGRLAGLISAEESRATGAEAGLQNAIDALEVKSDNKDANHEARLVELEATIVKDVEMFEEVLPGAGFTYTLAFPVQDENKDLVDVFVNGHRVRVQELRGQQITLVDPNYTIDSDDQVFFLYQK